MDALNSRASAVAPMASAAGVLTLGGELTVARLGFGAMRLTGRGIFGPPADREQCRRVVQHAVDRGVTFIDTADSYGPAVSEEIIADALFPYPARLVIATKAGLERPGPDEWVPNGRPEHLRQACEDSLRRLRLDRLDLFQLHRIDPAVPEAEQLDALAGLRDEGKIRFVGLSEVGVAEIERARRRVPIVSVQNKYNVVERTWDPVVEYCQREGLAFIPWFPLGAGDLGTADVLARVARRAGATPMQVAIAWLLARSRAILPIPGTSTLAHLDENVDAAAVRLSVHDMRDLDALGGA